MPLSSDDASLPFVTLSMNERPRNIVTGSKRLIF